jgi:hypothetical protein
MTKNTYLFPIKKEHVKYDFSKSPLKGVEIGKNGILANVPTHKVYKTNSSITDLTNAADILCDIDSPVHAALDGKVVDIQKNISRNYSSESESKNNFDEWGNFIVIEHPNAEYSIYAHLSKVLVKRGQRIKQGEKIAHSGHTGLSYEPHLHFGVFKYTTPTHIENLKVKWKK